MAKLGLDEQKLDIRPGCLGNLAMDRDTQLLFGKQHGKSNEAQVEVTRITPGDLCNHLEKKKYQVIGLATDQDNCTEVSRRHSSSNRVKA